MSLFIEFTLLPISILRSASIPDEKPLDMSYDAYFEQFELYGKKVCDKKLDGGVLIALLVHLSDNEDVELMTSEFDVLRDFLSELGSIAHFIFTKSHKKKYLHKLEKPYSEYDFEATANTWYGPDEKGVSKIMVEGVKLFHQCLSLIDDESVIIFRIF